MKESLSLRFLYNTIIGRGLLKILTRPFVSNLSRIYLNSPLSKCLVRTYIKKYHINMNEFERKNYKSFNSFFIRKKRRLDFDSSASSLICPCDGYLSVYKISKDASFKIKNTIYSAADILNDSKLAEKFDGGICLVFRLAPHNYHRYIYIDSGEVIKTSVIKGVLHCVRPIACDRYPVYLQNSRELSYIKTDNFGSVIQMEIGALLVGRIKNICRRKKVCRGMEKGYFEFGGSTIIVMLQKDIAVIDDEIIVNSLDGCETRVRIGERIGFSAMR